VGSICLDVRAANYWNTTDFEVTFPPHCVSKLESELVERFYGVDINAESMTDEAQKMAAIELGFSDLQELREYFRLIEFTLLDIAVDFQELGFPEPDLLAKSRDGKTFMVQYRDLSKGMLGDCDTPSNTKAFVTNPLSCDKRQQVFVINAAVWSPNGRRKRDAEIGGNPGLYDADGGRYDRQGLRTTLAHELFHAIQGSYDRTYESIQPCRKVTIDGVEQIQDFGRKDEAIMVEGMAQAVAVELSDFPDQPLHRSLDRKVLGGYPYAYDIFDPPAQSAYYLASFWRYLSDRSGGLGYLDSLLKRPVGNANPDDLIRAQWLDGYFRESKSFKESFYTLFPAAMSEVFSYGRLRYSRDRVRRKWLDWMTKKGAGCYKAETSPHVAKFVIDLEPYSAACFEIRWPGFPNKVELHFEAIVKDDNGSSEFLADQLHLGLAVREVGEQRDDCWSWKHETSVRTCVFEKVRLSTGPTAGSHARWWIPDEEIQKHFRSPGSYLLVLSNIAPANRSVGSKLRRTARISDLTFRVGFGGTLDANGKPLPPPRARGMLGSTDIGDAPPAPAGPDRSARETARAAGFSSGSPAMFGVASTVAALVPASLSLGGNLAAGATAGSLVDLGLPNLQSFLIGEPGERQYLVTPVVGLADYELGDTGILQGEVALFDPNAEETSLRLHMLPSDPEDMDKAYTGRIVEGPSSRWCQSGAGAVEIANGQATGGRIGTIIRSSEDELVIEIQTELCLMTYTWGDERPQFKVAENVQFTMTLPFGWRYFNKTMPQPVDAPGLTWYDERFPEARRAANLASGKGSGFPDAFDTMGLSRLGEMPGACSCGCDELLGLDPAETPECASLGCINQMAQCRASGKIRESVVVSYRGTIGIRAMMALRKNYDDRGILNQNLNERSNTITVQYQPALIQQTDVEQFLRDLGVDVVPAAKD
jgi:hypothetical protein